MNAIIVFLGLLLTGCASDRPNPSAPLGIVRLLKAGKLGRAKFEKVDEEPVKGWTTRLELPPGHHTLEISFQYGDGISAFHSGTNCPLRFNIENGKVYVIAPKVKFEDRTWSATLTDVFANKILDECKSAQP